MKMKKLGFESTLLGTLLIICVMCLTPICGISQTTVGPGIVNSYFPVLSISGTTVDLGPRDGFNHTLSVGDRVLLVQMTGSTGANGGKFEYANIESASPLGTGFRVVLSNVNRNYSPASEKVQLVWVPRDDVSITISGDIRAKEWDGSTGGIISLVTEGTLVMNGDVTASGTGFRVTDGTNTIWGEGVYGGGGSASRAVGGGGGGGGYGSYLQNNTTDINRYDGGGGGGNRTGVKGGGGSYTTGRAGSYGGGGSGGDHCGRFQASFGESGGGRYTAPSGTYGGGGAGGWGDRNDCLDFTSGAIYGGGGSAFGLTSIVGGYDLGINGGVPGYSGLEHASGGGGGIVSGGGGAGAGNHGGGGGGGAGFVAGGCGASAGDAAGGEGYLDGTAATDGSHVIDPSTHHRGGGGGGGQWTGGGGGGNGWQNTYSGGGGGGGGFAPASGQFHNYFFCDATNVCPDPRIWMAGGAVSGGGGIVIIRAAQIIANDHWMTSDGIDGGYANNRMPDGTIITTLYGGSGGGMVIVNTSGISSGPLNICASGGDGDQGSQSDDRAWASSGGGGGGLLWVRDPLGALVANDGVPPPLANINMCFDAGTGGLPAPNPKNADFGGGGGCGGTGGGFVNENCALFGGISDIGLTDETCNDNGTSSDGTDDFISFSLNPTGTLLGTGYTVSVDNGGTVSPTTASYGSATNFQLQAGSADGTLYTISITDNEDAGCTFMITVQQNPCSDGCDLTSDGKTNETCNDNNTSSDATDDYISFSLNPTGTNLGSGYTVSVDNGGVISPTSGTYGAPVDFQLQSGSANATLYTITITDNADPNCTAITTVQQNPCSDACNLMADGKTNEDCNDNNTATNSSDDYISFDINPTGINLGSGYTVSVDNGGVISPTSGTYGSPTSFRLQDGSANGTLYTVTITDNSDANCTLTITMQMDPCSLDCPPNEHTICENDTNFAELTAESGFSNYVWYEYDEITMTKGVQVGTGQVLTLYGSDIGPAGSRKCYVYEAQDSADCSVELCCPVCVMTEECCPDENCFGIQIQFRSDD